MIFFAGLALEQFSSMHSIVNSARAAEAVDLPFGCSLFLSRSHSQSHELYLITIYFMEHTLF